MSTTKKILVGAAVVLGVLVLSNISCGGRGYKFKANAQFAKDVEEAKAKREAAELQLKAAVEEKIAESAEDRLNEFLVSGKLPESTSTSTAGTRTTTRRQSASAQANEGQSKTAPAREADANSNELHLSAKEKADIEEQIANDLKRIAWHRAQLIEAVKNGDKNDQWVTNAGIVQLQKEVKRLKEMLAN